MDIKNLGNFYTLLLLWEGQKHGYEISKHIEEKTGKKLSPGQIYPFLQSLLDNGYLIIAEIGERDKKSYELTKNGKEFVKEQLERFGELISIAIEPKLKKCYHCGCKLVSDYFEENGKIFCCSHCAKSFMHSK